MKTLDEIKNQKYPHLAQGSSNHKNLFLGASVCLCRTPKAALNFKSQLLQPLALCKLILSSPRFVAGVSQRVYGSIHLLL
jgi:hypothetical protein